MSYLPFVISDKKRGVVLDMRVVMYIGRELANEIFVRGNVFFLRDVVRTYIYIYIFSLLYRYIVLTL